MRKLLLLSVVLLVTFYTTLAQSPTAKNCPSITVSGPAGITSPGENINVSALVTPPIQNVKYFWSTSAGKITKDQGPPATSIATTMDNNFSEIAVRVELDGLPKGCPNFATEKFGVSNGIFDLFAIEEFPWKVSQLNEGVRLDNLAIQLKNSDESNIAYIVLRTERSRKAVEQRVQRMKEWLFNKASSRTGNVMSFYWSAQIAK